MICPCQGKSIISQEAAVELKVIELSDIEKMQGEHCLIIISNGQMKSVELPSFGTTVIESHCNKVKQVKEEVKQLF